MGQAAFEFDTPPPAFETDTAFEIGWDFAHFALTPPGEHLQPGSALQQGFDAGRASFGTRTLAPTQHTRKWLQLRLNAWRRGRIFEGPSAIWFRLRYPLLEGEEPSVYQRVAVAADSGNGISAILDFTKYGFVNSDLTINLLRRPRGEWIRDDPL